MVAGTQVTFWGVLNGALFIVLLVFCIMLVGKFLADALFAIENFVAAQQGALPGDTITDGYTVWSACCPNCGGRMQVVRPGMVQCENCG